MIAETADVLLQPPQELLGHPGLENPLAKLHQVGQQRDRDHAVAIGIVQNPLILGQAIGRALVPGVGDRPQALERVHPGRLEVLDALQDVGVAQRKLMPAKVRRLAVQEKFAAAAGELAKSEIYPCRLVQQRRARVQPHPQAVEFRVVISPQPGVARRQRALDGAGNWRKALARRTSGRTIALPAGIACRGGRRRRGR